MTLCPLCQSHSTHLFWSDNKRDYHQCAICDLVFVPLEYHLSSSQEKQEYDKHDNRIDDPGYLSFLARTYSPLMQRVKKKKQGLDFGCGPAPALAHYLSQHDRPTSVYDLYYFPDPQVLERQYDFITCTEVLEHIANPNQAFELWTQLLKSNTSLLAIMTKRLIDRDAFKTWHYKNDPTHICFYSDACFRWIANQWQFELEFIDKDVVFLTPK